MKILKNRLIYLFYCSYKLELEINKFILQIFYNFLTFFFEQNIVFKHIKIVLNC